MARFRGPPGGAAWQGSEVSLLQRHLYWRLPWLLTATVRRGYPGGWCVPRVLGCACALCLCPRAGAIPVPLKYVTDKRTLQHPRPRQLNHRLSSPLHTMQDTTSLTALTWGTRTLGQGIQCATVTLRGTPIAGTGGRQSLAVSAVVQNPCAPTPAHRRSCIAARGSHLCTTLIPPNLRNYAG